MAKESLEQPTPMHAYSEVIPIVLHLGGGVTPRKVWTGFQPRDHVKSSLSSSIYRNVVKRIIGLSYTGSSIIYQWNN